MNSVARRIGAAAPSPGNAHFVPPPPSHIEGCMAALERFIHDEHAPYPTLVKARWRTFSLKRSTRFSMGTAASAAC